MPETFHVVAPAAHERLVVAAYRHRGFEEAEARQAARLATAATRHGIRTHNAIKALHLDDLFGSRAGGCRPGATIRRLPSRFDACEVWDADRKLGQAVAWEAIETCIALADVHGSGTVSVDNAFHYLWGGGYVMEAARRGYLAYTNCTAALAEVVPFGGVFPTLGTNPHSWGFPTTAAVGFPVVIDWATSVIAMGRVQQLAREGKPLPAEAAVDEAGRPTTDPHRAVSLLPFGGHKGYGLSLINELVAGLIGGSLPTLRSCPGGDPGERHCCTFFFQVIHPDAISGGAFAHGRSQAENVRAVLADILGHGNERCRLPGQPEAEAAARCDRSGGLLFSTAEVEALNEFARAAGLEPFDVATLPRV
ncbi:MAG: Ldh family oxidoreductase [Planctomycetes bacterium]|nr:Ldh family oxidoreductase [Planctomycetota bacterium]MBM4057696.1 Ldh family oxidoreductase [Planctomycetota bacterium]